MGKKRMINVLVWFALLPLYVFSQGITGDGKYVFAPVNRFSAIVVQSTENNWKKEIKNNPVNVSFLNNDQFVYQENDTIFIQQLGSDNLRGITNVKSFQTANLGGAKWIMYLLNDAENTLVCEDPLSAQFKLRLQNIVDFLIPENQQCLLVKQKEAGEITIMYLHLPDLQVSLITESDYQLRNFVFDKTGTQMIFMGSSNQKEGNSIWYFKKGMNQARILVTNSSKGMENQFQISNDQKLFGFTPAGSSVFFRLEKKPDTSHLLVNAPSVDIWSYTDALIQPQQITWAFPFQWLNYKWNPNIMKPKFLAATDIETKNCQIVRLQEENEIICGVSSAGKPIPQVSDGYAIICRFSGNLADDFAGEEQAYLGNDFNWNKASHYSVYLVSLENGKRELIRSNVKFSHIGQPTFLLSPSGRYLFFFDDKKKSFFSYEIATKREFASGNQTKINWVDGDSENPRDYYSPKLYYYYYWIKDKDYVLVPDHYNDIWKIDVTGKQNPVNITGFLGRKQGISFSIIGSFAEPLDSNSNLLLRAEKETNFGFFRAGLRTKSLPQKLLMGPYHPYSSQVVKASSSETYIVVLESGHIPKGTCYFTKDFSKFNPISTNESTVYHPIDKEECHWKTFSGKKGFGLLYKPDGFDKTKRYPVIFSYYEMSATQTANEFEEYEPKANIGNDWAAANLAYCLNNGYLVFIPDIHYTLGSSGESVYDYVISGAKYLSQFSFVDSRKMGLSGHSFGGWETNYLVTHSNLFAAACSGSGLSDLFSLYGHINNDLEGYPFTEGQVRIGVLPWERPDLFIKNSPIFYADKVGTPLLLMANKNDLRVPYDQGIELFKALRRLGKKCWLVQYDNGKHGLRKKEDEHDWGIRQMQFFDHYLKGASAPVWMTRGIAAKQKGKTLGYEYDSTMRTPGPGLLMENDAALTPEQKVLLKHRTTVSEDGRIIDVKSNKKVPAVKGEEKIK